MMRVVCNNQQYCYTFPWIGSVCEKSHSVFFLFVEKVQYVPVSTTKTEKVDHLNLWHAGFDTFTVGFQRRSLEPWSTESFAMEPRARTKIPIQAKWSSGVKQWSLRAPHFCLEALDP